MSRLRILAAASAVLMLAACGGGTPAPAPADPSPTFAGDPTATAAPASEPASTPPSTPPSAPPSEPATGSACSPTTDTPTVDVAMADIAFQPGTISAGVGDVIGWTNGDAPPHTATLRDDPACTTPTLARGETGSLVFSAPGSYPFFCKIHPSMTGTIEITG